MYSVVVLPDLDFCPPVFLPHFPPEHAAKRALAILEGNGRKTGGQKSKGKLRVVGALVSKSAK